MIAITNTEISEADRQDPLKCNNILSCTSVRSCRRLRIQQHRRRRRTQSLSSLYYMWLVIILQTNINQFDEIQQYICNNNICRIKIDLVIHVVVAAKEGTYNNNTNNNIYNIIWNETITRRNIVDQQQQQHWFEQHQLRSRNTWQQTIQQWLHRRRRQKQRQRRVKNEELNLTNQNKYNSTTIQQQHSLHIPIISDPTLTYHLHPTAILTIPSERRKLHLSSYKYGSSTYSNDTNYNTISINRIYNNNNKTTYTTTTNRNRNIENNILYQQWFAKEETSSIYATIPDQDDPNHIHNRLLHEFYNNRHLSRYEQFYRTTNQYNLQSNWNGYYDQTFHDTIVQFDTNTTTFSMMNNDIDTEGYEDDDWLSSFKQDIVSKLYPRRQRKHWLNNTIKRRLDHRKDTSYSNDNTIVNGGFYNNYQAVPLSQGYGTHFANVWVGTPTPQRKTVIVDTGSHYTAFPCTGCKNCGAPHHTDPYYRPENSNTFQQLQCNECQDGVLCENSKWYRNESDCYYFFVTIQ